jgi:predicted nucleic acid-binding protein
MLRIYWDTCVLIYRVQGIDPWMSGISTRLAERPNHRLTVSELTRLECRTKPLQEQDKATLAAFDRIFNSPRIGYAKLERSVFDLATELRALQRLKTIDALHLAAAIDSGCEEFWTNDRRLERAAAGRIKVIALADEPE